MMIDLNCHDACKETQVHSVCLMPTIWRTPILAQMIHKLESLGYKPQNEKRMWQYARVEQILKGR